MKNLYNKVFRLIILITCLGFIYDIYIFITVPFSTVCCGFLAYLLSITFTGILWAITPHEWWN